MRLSDLFRPAARCFETLANSILLTGRYGRQRPANVEQLESRLMLSSYPPVLSDPSDIQRDEGELITVTLPFTDQDGAAHYTGTINWGDGTGDLPADILTSPELAVSGTHQYQDDDVYTVTVTVVEDDPTQWDSKTFQATIDNLAPAITDVSGISEVEEGSSYRLSLRGSDPGANDIITWTINWGDGAETTGITGIEPPPQQHVYADGPAAYQISVTASDDDGGQTTEFLSLDLSFGYDGKVITDLGGLEEAHAVVIQPDEKILVAGFTTVDFPREFALARYDMVGNLDPTFGSGGMVVDSDTGYAEILGMALQSDGRIVVAGNAGNQFVVARYNTDGTLDDGGPDDSTPGDSFGTDGTSHVDFGFRGQDLPLGMKVDSNDGIWVAGDISGAQGWDFCLLHFDSQGELDTDYFNPSEGYVSTDLGGDDIAHDLVVQPNDNILVVGEATTTHWEAFGLVRYQSDGSLDDNFGTDGKVLTEFGRATSVALQDDGKIVVAGSAGGDLALARYTSSGALDGGFGGGDGKVTVDFGGTDSFWSVSIQEDDKIVVGGHTTGSSTREFALARFGSDGTPDPTFGQDGKLTVDFYENEDFCYDMAIQPDGRIVAVGQSIWDFAITRVGFLAVHDVAPTLTLSPTSTVVDWGESFELNFSATDPGNETVDGWTISWGDGTSDPYPGNASGSLTHYYGAATGPSNYTVTVTLHNEDGDFSAAPLDVAVTALGWRLYESGGSASPGGAEYYYSSATGTGNLRLTEGDSFLSALSREIIVGPSGSFTLKYDDYHLDQTQASEWINDAFEIALLDTDGNSLVPTIGEGRDAFFNATEGLTNVLLADDPGIIHDDIAKVVTVSGLTPGTQGLLTLRLINNDDDSGSYVEIPCIEASIWGDGSVDEGSLYTLDLTPGGNWTDGFSGWQIDWDDAIITMEETGATQSTHYFADDGYNNLSGIGYYDVTAYYTIGANDRTIQVTDSYTVQVNNVAPTLYLSLSDNIGYRPQRDPVTEDWGVEITITGEFSDPGFDAVNTQETFAVEIDWDGDAVFDPVSSVTVTQGGPGTLTEGRFSATYFHVIEGLDQQDLTATIKASDDDGGVAYGQDGFDVTYTLIGITLNPASINLGGEEPTVNARFNYNGTAKDDIDITTLEFGPAGVSPDPGWIGQDKVAFKAKGTGLQPIPPNVDAAAFIRGNFVPEVNGGGELIAMGIYRVPSGAYQGGGELAPADTKFYVADSGLWSPNQGTDWYHVIHGYGIFDAPDPPVDTSDYPYNVLLTGDQTYPIGIAHGSTTAGERVWIVDALENMVVVWNVDRETTIDPDMGLEHAGSWELRARDLTSPTGITVFGDDIWVVDDNTDAVFLFVDAATQNDGAAAGSKAFALYSENSNPSDIVTDGTYFWVVDNVADSVFVYDAGGNLQGYWSLSSLNANPSGITINVLEDNQDGDIWVVDRTTKEVYWYQDVRNLNSPNLSGGQYIGNLYSFDLRAENSQPEGIADPPVLNLDSPADPIFPAGSTFLITGQATPDEPPNDFAITDVTVDGTSVTLNGDGTFSTGVQIGTGQNDFEIVATDAGPSSTTKTLTLYGSDQPAKDINFSLLSEVTGGFSAAYGRTSFNGLMNILFADLTLTDASGLGVRDTLLVGVRDISDLTVQLVAPDGVAPDGTWYYDLSDLAFSDSDSKLDIGEMIEGIVLHFHNPNRIQFDYELVVLGQLNHPPQLPPDTEEEAFVGGTWEYEPSATDADEDELTYTAPSALPGNITFTDDKFSLNPATSTDVGIYILPVAVDDGHGGSDYQRITLKVSEGAPNHPPEFTSDPITYVYFQQTYEYQATAKDDDGDTVTFFGDFSGYEQPTGIRSVALDGLVTFTPHADDVGKTFWFELTATDGQAEATQAYGIHVYPTNNDPIIRNDPAELITHDTATGLTPSGNVSPDYLYLNLSVGETDTQIVSIDLDALQTTKADIIFLVDESGSMGGQHDWIADMVPALEAGLVALGIDDNRYGLVGFGGPPTGDENPGHKHDVGGGAFGTTTDLVTALSGLRGDGNNEDGYSALWHALRSGEYDFRDDATICLILITDDYREDRDSRVDYTELGLTDYEGILSDLEAEQAVLNVVVSATFDYESGGPAAAADSAGKAYLGQHSLLLSYDETWVGNHWVGSDKSILIGEGITGELEDTYGYRAAVSDQGEELFEDISTSPDATELSLACNDSRRIWGTDLPGFAFPFYGQTYNDFRVSTNGLITFGRRTKTPDNTNLDLFEAASYMYPDVADGAIAVFWDDLIATSPDAAVLWALRGTGDEQRLIIQWDKIDHTVEVDGEWQIASGQGDLTFQAILYENGEIRINYKDLDHPLEGGGENGKLATIGITHFMETGYETGPNGTYSEGTGTTYGDYVQLAWDRYSSAWNINVVETGKWPTSGFTDAFVEATSWSIQQQFSHIGLEATEAGLLTGGGDVIEVQPGQTHMFYPEFTGDGEAHSFELNFVTSTGIILGSIPVSLNSHYRYYPDAYDQDGDDLNYDLSIKPTGAEMDPETGEITWMPSALGPHNFELVVTDGRGGKATRSWTVQVDPPTTDSNPPYFTTTLGDQTAYVYRPFSFQVQATDDDAGQNYLQYYLTDAPSGMSIDVDSGGISWTPVLAQAGNTYPVLVKVLNNIGGFTEGGFNITVSSRDPWANTRPNFTSSNPDPGLAVVGGAPFTYDADAEDDDDDPLEYDLPIKPDGMLINPKTGLVEWEPPREQIGTHEVVLRVRDGRGGVAAQKFDVIVVENFAPVIIPQPHDGEAVVGTRYYYKVIAYDPNPQDTLTFSMDPVSGLDEIDIHPDTGVIDWTPVSGDEGTYAIRIIVQDDDLASGVWDYELEVVASATNHDPSIISSQRTVVGVGQTYFYQVIAADEDDDPLTYHLDGGTSGLVFDTDIPSLLTWTPTDDDLGTHSNIEVWVEDGRGGSSTHQVFDLEVVWNAANGKPEFDSDPLRYATVGNLYLYEARAEDPDGDPLSWILEKAPIGMSLIAGIDNTCRLVWIPAPDQLRDHEVVIRAMDPVWASETQEFTITVGGGNIAPMFDTTPPTKAVVDGVVPYVYFVHAWDPDGDSSKVTYDLDAGAKTAGLRFDDQYPNKLVWDNPSPSALASQQVTIFATDEHGGTSRQGPFTIQVVDIAEAYPTITSVPDSLYATRGRTYKYPVEATNPNSGSGIQLIYSVSGDDADDMFFNDSDPEYPGLHVLTWTPEADDPDGLYWVYVTVQEDGGNYNSCTQGLPLTVFDNTDPSIVFPAENSMIKAVVGAPIKLQVFANEEDEGDWVTYEPLATVPTTGMMIDADTGVITWTPDEAVTPPGTLVTVTAEVSDQFGGSDQHNFEIKVVEDEPPYVWLQKSLDRAPMNEKVFMLAQAWDDVDIATLTLTVDGVEIPMNEVGFASYTAPDHPAKLLVVATAVDTAGQISEDSFTLRIYDPSNTVWPEAAITSPDRGESVTQKIDVVGTVKDDQANVTYTLGIAPANTDEYIDLTPASPGEVINGKLGELDPSKLRNGIYALRLEATDDSGNITTFYRVINIEGNLKLGNFDLSFVDLMIPLAGIPITIQRTYDTLTTASYDDFGYGWSANLFHADISVDPTTLGSGDSNWAVAWDDVRPFMLGTRVYVELPGGIREGFTFSYTSLDPQYGNPYGQLGSDILFGLLSLGKPVFLPDAGNTTELTLEGYGAEQVFKMNDGTFLTADRAPFNPAAPWSDLDYVITSQDGLEYRIDCASGKLLPIRDRNDNSIEITDTGIVVRDPDGNKLAEIIIERDELGRIISITDPIGVASTDDPNDHKITYHYDAATGDLISVTDRTGKTTEFKYEADTAHGYPVDYPHYLTEIVAPNGVSVMKIGFDPATGRIQFVKDAANKQIVFDYQTDTRFVEKVDDPYGQTELVRDGRGNVIRRIQFLEHRTTPSDRDVYLVTAYQYSADDLLEQESLPYEVEDVDSDPNDDDAKYTVGPAQWDVLYTYHTNGRLKDHQKYIGDDGGSPVYAVTSYTYDEFGNPRTISDPLENTIINSYDEKGNLKQTTAYVGLDADDNPKYEVTKYEYNADGTLKELARIDEGGNKAGASTFTYQNGLLKTITDASGFTRNFEYDLNGNQTKSWYLWNGSTKVITETKYDDEGRVKGKIQWAGPVDAEVKLWETFITYDDAGRVETSTNPYGIVTTNTYDVRGNLIETYTKAKEDGADVFIVTRTVYDDYGRPIDQSDPHKEDVGADGKPVSIYSQGTRTEYDALGRVKRTERLQLLEIVLADDPVYSGQKISTLDDLFIGFPITSSETITTYDIAGRVESVDAPGVWLKVYEYDAAGQSKHTAWDADGDINTTGDRTTAAQYQYDAAGRQQYVTHDFDGDLHLETGGTTGDRYMTQYVYDGLGRVERTIYPDPDGDPGAELPQTETAVTYDSLGRRVAETDQMGQTTYYKYDDAGRLTAVILPTVTIENPVNPDQYISVHPRYEYDYDDYGNQMAIRDNIFQSYDATIDSSGARQTTFTYDHLNRMLTRTLPLGQTETFDYYDDPAVDADHELGQLKYTIDFEGCVTAYEYDEFARVEYKHFFPSYSGTSGDSYQEWVADDAIDHEAVRYKYDAFGRRLEVIQDADGDLTTTTDDQYKTTYAYNARGQVTQIEYIDTADTDGELFKGLAHYTYDEATGALLTHTRAGKNLTIVTTQIEYYYDDLGRLETLHMAKQNGQEVSHDVVYTYDALGNLKKLERKIDSVLKGTSEYVYDGLSRLTSLTQKDATGSALASYDYTLRDDGRRVSANEFRYVDGIDDVTTQIDWAYDNLGRLIIEAYNSSDDALDYAAIYAFDLVGNRLSRQTPGESIEYSYDANDRLLTEKLDADGDGSFDETTAYKYGPNADPGNGVGGDSTTLTTKVVHSGEGTGGAKLSETTYQYNLQGRQSRVEVDSDGDGPDPAEVEEYLYNDDGVRVAKIEDPDGMPTNTYFIIDTNNPTGYAQVLEEYEANSSGQTLKKSYVIGLDVEAQWDSTNGLLYLLPDGHGSTRLLTDENGALVAGQVFDYDAYGNMLDGTVDPLTTHLYAGEQMDKATGAYYLRARYYDPATGRFSRMDPFAGINSDPISLHKYLYIGADPINRIDPSGLVFISNVIYGNAVHKAIGANFVRLRRPYGVYSLSITEIVGLAGISRLQPDLVDTNPKVREVYEIKPILSEAKGLLKLELYLSTLNSTDPTAKANPWKPGTTYVPPSVISLDASTIAVVTPPVAGLIIYYVIDMKEVVAMVTAYTTIRFKLHFMIADLLTTRGALIPAFA